MKKRGYFSIHEDVEYHVTMEDIVENLDIFSQYDLDYLLSELLLSEPTETKSHVKFPDNLYDEQKFKIALELYEKLNLEELQKIKEENIS